MKLEEAQVDLRGRLVAAGQMWHEPDSAGHFPTRSHDSIVLSRVGDWLYLGLANAKRDPVSNFMETYEIGLTVVVPSALKVAVQDGLAHRAGTIQLSLPRQEGTLTAHVRSKGEWHQPLSNWRLELEEDSNAVKVVLSASLLATEQMPAWDKSAGNFWPSTGGDPARLQAIFYVNHATRIAMFGALLPSISHGEAYSGISLRKSSAQTIDLANAPVGVTGSMVAFSPQGFVSVIDGRPGMPMLSWQPCHAPQRYATGFLDSVRFREPSVWLAGTGLGELCKLVALKKRATIELRDGDFGYVQWDARGENPFLRIRLALLELRLTANGLDFSYRLSSVQPPEYLPPSMRNGVIEGLFTLPWEVLIVRYPILAPYRSEFSEVGPETSDD